MNAEVHFLVFQRRARAKQIVWKLRDRTICQITTNKYAFCFINDAWCTSVYWLKLCFIITNLTRTKKYHTCWQIALYIIPNNEIQKSKHLKRSNQILIKTKAFENTWQHIWSWRSVLLVEEVRVPIRKQQSYCSALTNFFTSSVCWVYLTTDGRKSQRQQRPSLYLRYIIEIVLRESLKREHGVELWLTIMRIIPDVYGYKTPCRD